MRLKRLRLQGFKSFADKTEIRFDQQIAGVVGPNGCGKSNIVDAIRWVMGEQSAKGLRGKDMSDVIFAGTPSRKAAGFAEVSMCFDNSEKTAPIPYTELPELVITRRLFRTGESEYLINDQASRLKDITDLFLGTGSSAKAYSIVAQGKVDEVVLAKPEDRRTLIEEAAGIAKYKIRRISAERKMKSTNENLSRVEDILKELERNARSLERQVEKAEKFRALQTELRETDERLISAKVVQLDQRASENSEALLKSKEIFESSSAELIQIEAKIEKARLEALNHEKLSSSDYEALMQKKEQLSSLETESELAIQKNSLLRNQMAEREKDIERLAHKYEDHESSKISLASEIEKLSQQKETRDSELAAFKQKIDQATQHLEKSEAELKALELELQEIKAVEAKERQKLELLQAERVDLEMERASVEREIEQLEIESKVTSQKLLEIRERLQDFKAQKLRLETSRKAADQSAEGARQKLQLIAEQISETKQERIQTEEKLESLTTLEEHQVGYEPGALAHKQSSGESFLMDQIRFKEFFSAPGQKLMSDFGQVFLGQDVATESDLRWSRVSISPSPKSFEKSLLDWVSDDCELSETLRSFLSSVAWVAAFDESAEHLQVNDRGDLRIPLGGQSFLESSGELKVEQSPFARRDEKNRLQELLSQLANKLQELEAQQEATKRELSESVAEMARDEQSLVVLAEKVELENQELRKELEAQARLQSIFEQSKSRIGRLDDRISGVSQQLFEKTAFLEPTELLAKMESLKAQIESEKKSKADLDAAWIEFRIETGAVNEKLERLQEQAVSLDMTQSEYRHNESVYKQDIQNWRSEIEASEQRLVQVKESIEGLRSNLIDLEKKLAHSKESLQGLNAQLEELERQRKFRQSEKDEKQQSLSELELQKQGLRHQVEELSQILYERYQVELSTLLEKVDKESLQDLEDASALEKLDEKSKYLRERLHKFGDVNLVALQEFEQIKTRLDFMQTQREDLLKTLDNLQSIIDRINNITEFRFRETFKAINHNFQLLFPKLFGGGKAYMRLTDESNLLESGVEIYAEPPGKKIQAMSLLSGGEKAMTSISLIFSLFAFRPSSFCILDEVDAPLDDINTRRYNEIIKEMAALSQFIVITHNKRTMEVAETLFGVTMQEPGCSRLVGVSLQEARTFSGTDLQKTDSGQENASGVSDAAETA